MPKKTARPLAVLYHRNSRLNGRARGDNNSIDLQRQTTPEIADKLGYDVLCVIEEEDTSGVAFDRPGWIRAVTHVQDGEAEAIIGWDFDRISRAEAWVTAAAVADVESMGGHVFDRSGPITVSDEQGAMLTMMRGMVAHSEWRKRREYSIENVRKAIVEKGAHLAAPYGYRKPGKGAALVVNEPEARVVRRVYELRGEGWSYARIANLLNEEGIAPRAYKRHEQIRQATWSGHHLRRLCANEVYLGVAYSGEFRHPGAHEAVVTPALYAKANRAKGRKWGGPDSGYLLSGLVRCASCGYAMPHGGLTNGRRYYQCQRKAAGCAHPVSVPAEALESLAREQFAAQVRELRAYKPVRDDADLRVALGEQEDARADLARMLARFASLGDLSEVEQAIVDEQVSGARAAVARAEESVAREQHAANGMDLPGDLDADGFDSLPVEEQRHLLGLVFAGFVVRSARVWREDVAERVRPLRRDQAPTNSTALIPFVAALG